MAKEGKKVGEITHYYNNIGVGIIKLSAPIKIGDTLRFQGGSTDFEQQITEMQYDHKPIKAGKKGQEVGIKVAERVRDGDEVLVL